VLDAYFTFTSFFGEEEFYLLTLPFVFWNGGYDVARHVNNIVCLGLLAGNNLKLLFELPRPRGVNNDIKVPGMSWEELAKKKISGKGSESSNYMEYGFPSTHAMNAVTNVSTALAFAFGSFAAIPTWAAYLAVVWILSLSVGRMYLGMHTPVDVRYGLLLGTTVAATYITLAPTVGDRWLYGSQHLAPQLFVWILAGLYFSPNHAPSGTFYQNTTCLALFAGSCAGARLWHDFASLAVPALAPMLAANTPSFFAGAAVSAMFARWVVGLVLVQTVRTIVKTTLKAILKSLFCVDVKATLDGKQGGKPTVTAFVGINLIKIVTYIMIGVSVLFVIPCCFQVAGVGVY
jgi:sphingosine-1-phosphate phosphatase 1